MTFLTELERLLKAGDLQRASILLTNHADAILGLVRDMERIAEWGCDQAEKYDGTCAGDIVRLAQSSLAKLGGEGK